MEEARGVKSKELFPSIFSRHASAYARRLEQIMLRGEARGRQRVIELVEARPGMRVLDMACGPGTLSRKLAPLVAPGGEVVGIDLATGMIELARAARIPNATFSVMDVERLDFPDQVFDAAVCAHGLQFVPDLAAALHEAWRVLRPGARFAASVPIGSVKDSIWAMLEAVIDRWLPPPVKAVDQDATGAAVRDAAAFRATALGAGFRSAEVEVVEENVRWESAEQIVAMCTSWWDCAARLEGMDEERRRAFSDDAVETLKRAHPGAIETTGRNHVLFALR